MKPKIRFKEFNEEWNTFNLGNLTSIVTGATPSTAIASYWNNGSIRWMSSGELNDKHIYDVKGRITNDGYNNSGTHIIPPSCVLIGLAGQGKTRGTAAINHVELCTNQSIAAILPNPRLFNSLYLYHYIDNKYLELRNLSAGDGGRGGLNKQILLDFEVNLPSLDEQKATASFFENLDSLIQSSTKKIESLKQVKAAGLQSMFPKEGETKPCVRFKGYDGDWIKVLVGNLGTTYSGLTGKTKDDFGQGDAKFVTFLNVLTNAKIDTSILESVNVSNGERQNEVKKGDLLFNTSSETPEEVGMCAVMDDELENVYLNSFCFGFRITDENIDPTFIAYLMRSHIGRGIMSILAQGATRYNLSKNNFCKTELLLPKFKAEQAAIGKYFSSLDKQIILQTQRLEKLKQIKSACLDNMFV